MGLISRDPWPATTKASSFVSLVVGVIALGQLAYGGVLKFGQRNVPFWLLLTACATCYCSGLLTARLFRNRKGGVSQRLAGRIKFDYLPQSPWDRGWELGFDVPQGAPKVPPLFQAAVGAPVSGSISIVSKGRYYLDYPVGRVEALADEIEYCIKPTDGVFYVRVRISSRDQTQSKSVWLAYLVGAGPHRSGPDESAIEIQGELMADGWLSVRRFLPEDVARVYGNAGWTYQSIRRLRIRGTLSISPIAFHRSEPFPSAAAGT